MNPIQFNLLLNILSASAQTEEENKKQGYLNPLTVSWAEQVPASVWIGRQASRNKRHGFAPGVVATTTADQAHTWRSVVENLPYPTLKSLITKK